LVLVGKIGPSNHIIQFQFTLGNTNRLLELDDNTTNDDNDDVNDGRMEDTW